MFIDDLKKSILQKAIQGKLVEQSSNDEPASELLRRIREEKERLIKDGKIKKDKSINPITDKEKPFDIPESWEWVRVKDICYFGNGEKMSGKKYPYLEARYLRGKDAGKIYSEGNFVGKGNRLILVDGENSGEIFDLNEDGYLGSTFKIFNTYQSINPDYLQKFLLFRKDEFRNNKTGAAIPHLNKDLFFNYPLPLPPLEEQKRIVAKLDELMPLLDEAKPLEEEITALEKEFPDKLRQAILQYAIQGKLVEQNPNDEPASELLKKIKIGKDNLIKEGKIKKEKPLEPITDEDKSIDIPSGWEWVRFGDIALIERGGSPRPIDAYLTDSEDGLNWIKIGDTRKGYKYIEGTKQKIKPEGLYKTRAIEPGDFLLTNSMSFGEAYISKIHGCIHDGRLRIHPPVELDKDYLYWFLSSPYVQSFFSHSVAGAVVQNLNSERVRQLPLILPPLEEQKRIVVKLEELMKLCDELEEQIG